MSEEARALAITSAAVTGDSSSLYRVVTRLMDEGVDFDSVLFDHLLPAESGVGDRWQQGDYLVSEEHAATATIEIVVSLLVGMFDQPEDGPQVVIGAVSGDDHSLPGRAISASLLHNGYRTTFLGANLLAEDLGAFVEDENPDVVVLSCAMTTHLIGAHQSIAAVRAAGAPVIVGGQGFGPDDSRALFLGANAWSPSLRNAMSVIERELANPSSPEPVPPRSTDLDEFLHLSPAIAASVYAKVMNEAPKSDGRWLDEIEILLGAIAGSMLVNDPSVVSEAVDWHSVTLEAHGYPTDVVVGALDSTLSDMSESAAEVFSDALNDG